MLGRHQNKPVQAEAQVSEVQRLLDADNTPWWKKKNLRRLYFFLVPAALGVEMTSGYDGSVLNGLQAVERWGEYYNHPEGAILGIISAMMNIGSVASVFFVPYVNDRWGTRAVILLGSLIAVAGIVLQTSAINLEMLLVSRFVIGFGMPFAITGASQLISELAYPKERAVISGIFHESWYVGAIIAAGVTLGTFDMNSDWSWRLPTLFQVLPSVLQLSFIWFIPESPRFLIANDRHEEALQILIKYHAEGDASSPLAAAEFLEIRETLQKEKEATQQPWKALFTSSANIRRVLIAICVGLFAQWSGNGLVSYYLARVLSTVGITSRLAQNQINLGLMCWNLITGVVGSIAQKYMRRRVQWLASYGSMAVIYACWTAASSVYAADNENINASRAVVALIFVYYAFYNLMMPLAYLYITEVFPYLQRSKGLAIMLMMNRAGSAFNAFVNPIALGAIQWRMYIVYTCWIGVETGIIYFLYPETFGLSLEEASKTLDKAGHGDELDREKNMVRKMDEGSQVFVEER